MALDLLWSLNVALALAAGTVWSLPLAMIKSGARSSFSAAPRTASIRVSITRAVRGAGANLLEAMHGDRVVARVERETPKGLEGRIVQILERGNETIVGRFEADGSGLGYVVPFDRRVLTDIQIPTGQSSSAEPGEMVLVQITRWPTAARGGAAPGPPRRRG